ncbi:hypothetical protein MNBD_DELTA01-1932 [hydrothermal vent metagenome]|uniref:Heavy metal RND efflux outer membrane protein, CzcC family n=1 Tax=hydrothermal vent metagenome TaxID=652676 RepID=A0A3B0QVW7_9ZZZZ
MTLPTKAFLLRTIIATVTLGLSIMLAAPALAGNGSAAAAITKSPTLVTLETLIEQGLRDSPAIKTKLSAWKKAIERYPQARSLADPMLAYTQPIDELETRLGPIKRTIKLSQDFPFPGTLKTRGQVARKEAIIARLALAKATRRLVRDIKKAYFELYYLDKATELAREKTRLYKHLTRARSNDYSVDSTDFYDVIEAETRFADAEYELILLGELRQAAASNLNTLLNLEPENPIGPLTEVRVKAPEIQLSELYKDLNNNEELITSKVLIEKSVLKEKLALLKTRPAFRIGMNYTEIGTPEMNNIDDGGKDAVAATLAITLPIWHKKNKGGKAEAKYARLSAEQAKIALINSLNAKAKTSYIDMQSNYQLIKLYSDSLIPKADKLITTAEAAYKNGKGGLSDLFEPRIMRIQFEMAYYRAASNYKKNRAELEELTAGFVIKENNNE